MEGARQRRVLRVRAGYLAGMRKEAGLAQAEVAEAMGVSQQRGAAGMMGGVLPELAAALGAIAG